MEEDNMKDRNEPSTSKKPSHSNNSVEDNDSRDQERATNRETESDSYSGLSDVDMARTGAGLPTDPISKANAKAQLQKKRTKKLAGRIKKRERPQTKRQRRPTKRKPANRKEKKERDISVSTIFTRLSSSGFQTPGCDRCGHRCCLRRFENKSRKNCNRSNRKEIRKINQRVKRNKYDKEKSTLKISVGNQVGSRCKMLSPLFISTNALPEENLRQSAATHCEINPKMIHEALRRLTMWKQEVPTNSILEYISKKYPVNNEKSELMIELLEKLKIAAVMGIASRSSPDKWCLGHAFQKRSLSTNHVSMFWKLYGDTMRPIARKDNIPEQSHNTASNVNNPVNNEDVL